MKVEHKSYAQIVIASESDFIFSRDYRSLEMNCPFFCFPPIAVGDFRAALKNPEGMRIDKDTIFFLEEYWNQLSSEEKKAVLDHELGHISNGDLKRNEEIVKSGRMPDGKPKFEEERKADLYSVEMNGNRSMYNGLYKALSVMVKGYQKMGFRVNVSDLMEDKVLGKRMEIMKEEIEQEKQQAAV